MRGYVDDKISGHHQHFFAFCSFCAGGVHGQFLFLQYGSQFYKTMPFDYSGQIITDDIVAWRQSDGVLVAKRYILGNIRYFQFQRYKGTFRHHQILAQKGRKNTVLRIAGRSCRPAFSGIASWAHWPCGPLRTLRAGYSLRPGFTAFSAAAGRAWFSSWAHWTRYFFRRYRWITITARITCHCRFRPTITARFRSGFCGIGIYIACIIESFGCFAAVRLRYKMAGLACVCLAVPVRHSHTK